MKTVHVIFKTHLDVGFTDLAKNVINKYMNDFIPSAMERAEQLDTDGVKNFIWTTGSWLIDRYLKYADSGGKAAMTEAIQKGRIKWHGLPFTTHTELMDANLMEYGLSLSAGLDKRFGVKTISAKMTDVPGHTIAMVPYMARAGIEYLHIGVNNCCKKPSVPDMFIWRAEDGSEIIVNYAGDYGMDWNDPRFDDILVFAHTGDNNAPPPAEHILRHLDYIGKRYPGTDVKVSTLDEFAGKILKKKDILPVVDQEIGDTWIYRAAADPLKISHFRELLRLNRSWLERGKWGKENAEYAAFCSELLMVPEHTCGGDFKKFVCDYSNYSKLDFHAAKETDYVKDHQVPDSLKYMSEIMLDNFEKFHRDNPLKVELRSYSFLESTWVEQRRYLDSAIDCLPEELRREAVDALASLKPGQAGTSKNAEAIFPGERYKLGKFTASFGQDGAIDLLVGNDGHSWLKADDKLALYRYETFAAEDLLPWHRDYANDENYVKRTPFVLADFGKPGMDLARPRPARRFYLPSLRSLTLSRSKECDEVTANMVMPEYAATHWGAPGRVVLIYRFDNSRDDISIRLECMDKDAHRLPEAGWLSFVIDVGNPNLWKMDKISAPLSPLFVVENGNRNMHGVDTGVFYDGVDGSVTIETLDAPFVCPGQPRLWCFDNTFAPMDGGFHFNLHNNLFGTDVAQWFEGDMSYRFVITLK